MTLRSRPVVVAPIVLLLLGAGLTGRAAPVVAAPVSVWVHTETIDLWDPGRPTRREGVPEQAGRHLPTTLYVPDAPGRWPLIVFAPGFGVGPGYYDTLLRWIANSGYVVAAPTFPGSGPDGPGDPSEADLDLQPGDLSLVISAVVGRGDVDASRVGAVGHSDGGITVAALALGDGRYRDGRVRGAAVLAGTIGIAGTYGGNGAAMLVVNGTADGSNDWGAARWLYGAASAPRAMLTVHGGGHTAPYLGAGAQANAVRDATVAFLDGTVRNDPSGFARLSARTDLAGLQLEEDGISPAPMGSLDAVVSQWDARVRVQGWALDPDTTASIGVHVYVDGSGVPVVADALRPDVAAAFDDVHATHGFDVTLGPVGPGAHTVCAFGIDVGGNGLNTNLGCRTITATHDPIGALDEVALPDPRSGAVQPAGAVPLVRGWALDPDTHGPLTIHTYVDGRFLHADTTVQPRPDVAAAFAGATGTAGYGGGFGLVTAHGRHVLCAHAINVGPGTQNTTLGCRTFVVDRNPIGALDEVIRVGDDAHVRGWVIDPDLDLSTEAHVYVDGVGYVAPGDAWRPDVGAVFTAYGADHGVDITLHGLPPGPHTLCLFGINRGAGDTNPVLGCRAI